MQLISSALRIVGVPVRTLYVWLAVTLSLSALRSQSVGIGTNAPESRLHVAGTNPTLTVGPFGIGELTGRIVATGSGAEIGFVDRNLTSWPLAPAAGNRYVWYNQSGIARLWTDLNGDLVFINSDGYVGIGVSPGRPFIVQKNAPANTHTAAFVDQNGYGVFLGNVNNTTYGSIQGWGGGSPRNLILQAGGGRVGIATTNPQNLVHAIGTIEASTANPDVKSAMLTADGAVELLRDPGQGASPCNGVWGFIDFKDNRTDDYEGRINYGTSQCDGGTEQRFFFVRGPGGVLSVGTYGASGWGHSSDAHRKTDIKPLEGSLESILRLRPVSFRWKAEPERPQIGFIAQEVAVVFPEVVSYDEESGYILYHGGLTAPLAGAIQELYQIIRQQSEEIRQLRQRIAALEAAR